jgi:hypothetical protein
MGGVGWGREEEWREFRCQAKVMSLPSKAPKTLEVKGSKGHHHQSILVRLVILDMDSSHQLCSMMMIVLVLLVLLLLLVSSLLVHL